MSDLRNMRVPMLRTCVLALASLASALPNYHGCQLTLARSQPYCNVSLSIEVRVSSLIKSLTLEEKISRLYSCVPNCDTCPCAVDRVGLVPYAYLLEANTAVAAVCLGEDRCAVSDLLSNLPTPLSSPVPALSIGGSTPVP